MIRSLLVKFLLFTTIIFPFLFPAPGSANFDLGETPITLNMINKPTREIIKEIEKQTKYTIEILEFCDAKALNKALNNKITIVLNQIPLDQVFRRILKDLNYSVICDEKQEILTLVLLNKGTNSSAVSSRNNGESQTNTMGSLTAAFEDYENKKARHALTNIQE